LGSRLRYVLALAGLALVAAVVAVAIHLTLFDEGSLNADEVAYGLQAEAIADGELFLDVPQPADAHQPWFFVERPPGFVSKYLPLTSAFLALGLVLTGNFVPVLAVFAALVPILVAALARAIGFDRRPALAAAALTTLSPVVLIESALPLSYVPFLVLITTTWLLIVRMGLGRAGPASAAGLGLVAVAAACVRPYDAVLLIVPGVLWTAHRRRGDLVRLAPAATFGALPLGLAVLAYNAEATGRPWKLPFALLEPSDSIGFGRRRLAPEYDFVSFGPRRGLEGLVVHFGLGLLLWSALGVVLVPAAIAASRRAVGVQRMLIVLVVVHLAGYAIFWGPWNISIHWGGANRLLGPVYAMPLVVLIVLTGLPVLLRWRAERPTLIWSLTLVGLVIALGQLGSALWQASIDLGRTERVLAAADRAGERGGTVLIGVDPPYLGNPVTHLVHGYAIASAFPVPRAEAEAEAEAPRLLQLPRTVYGSPMLSYVVTQQRRLESSEIPLEVRLVERDADVLVVERAGRTTACALPPGRAVPIVLTPQGHRGCEGQPVPARWERDVTRHCPDDSCVAIAAFRRRSGQLRRVVWRKLPVDTSAGTVALLVDGEPLEWSGNGWLRVSQPAPGS
jgi:hypothetical protein